MKTVRSGSSLIYSLLYLSAGTVVIALLLQGTINLYPRLLTYDKRANSYLTLSLAVDAVVRDLYSAPHDISAWNSMSEHEISWRQDKKSIVWRYKKNRLIRTEGSFDPQKKRWRTKAKSIAADSLAECSFAIKSSERGITGCTIILTSTAHGESVNAERTIAMRSGVVYETSI